MSGFSIPPKSAGRELPNHVLSNRELMKFIRTCSDRIQGSEANSTVSTEMVYATKNNGNEVIMVWGKGQRGPFYTKALYSSILAVNETRPIPNNFELMDIRIEQNQTCYIIEVQKRSDSRAFPHDEYRSEYRSRDRSLSPGQRRREPSQYRPSNRRSPSPEEYTRGRSRSVAINFDKVGGSEDKKTPGGGLMGTLAGALGFTSSPQ